MKRRRKSSEDRGAGRLKRIRGEGGEDDKDKEEREG